MNAPREPWEDFAEVFADELYAAPPLTFDQMEAIREQYEREQIETAQSEATTEALIKEFSK